VVHRCRKFIGDFPRLRRLDGPRFTRRYYRRNLCEGNSATLRFNLVNLWNLPLVRAPSGALSKLRIAEAEKAIAVTRQQLYNVINGRSAVTPGMAVRFEEAFGGGADMRRRMQPPTTSRKCARAKKISVRRLVRPG
jgi:plasmid maintenance system antidote protein VapI